MRLAVQTTPLLVALTGAGVGVLALVGNPAPPSLSLLVVLERVMKGAGVAALYLLAAGGYGLLLSRLWRGSANARVHQFAAGLGVLLWLSHLAGWLAARDWLTACLLSAGLVLLVHGAWKDRGTHTCLPPEGVSRLWLIGAVPAAVLVVAACNPPGWLWASEFGGYDALSYHLALPQEWLADGGIRPLTHNVYSFLPGYVESAFYTLGSATFAPRPGTDAWGLLADDSFRVYACQFLHAGMTLLAAWWTGAAAEAACGRAGVPEERRSLARATAGLLVLATPWSVVTGSLAYNDMGVVAMLAAGMVAVLDETLTPGRRGLLVGLLVGIAVSIKPTAVLLVAAPLGLALALMAPLREWARLAGAGAATTLLVCAPWLIRNAIASGDPVFPFGAALFASEDGSLGHWSAEQVSRYAAAHRFDGSALDRLRLVIMPEPAREGVAEIARYRGLTHPQWAFFFAFAGAAAPTALWLARARSTPPGRRNDARKIVGVVVAMIVLQAMLWLCFTHIQSRFMLPAIVPCALAAAVALALIPAVHLRVTLGALACLAQAASTVINFVGQRGGRPNALLAVGTDARTGRGARSLLPTMSPEERRQWLASAGPEAHANVLHPGAGVCLLGGATPFYYTARVRYATTWDSPPLVEIVGDAPARDWNTRLRGAGIDLVVADLGELSRLDRSGWLDPRLRPGPILDWLHNHAMKIQAWPEAGIVLASTKPAQTPDEP